MNENEMLRLIEENERNNTAKLGDVNITEEVDRMKTLTRKIMVIGCGDGGCNIATAISKMTKDETFVIAYNTSRRNQATWESNLTLIVDGEDGSGKFRDYSKETFKTKAHKTLLDNVTDILNKDPEIAYIIVCATADGGTGSGMSPMAAKLLQDNVDIPVIMIGVYPDSGADATSHFNTLQWQSEVEKIGLPYFVLDNNRTKDLPTKEGHQAVNYEAAQIVSLLCGLEYGDTNISIIDNRNLYMLINQLGGHMYAAFSTKPVASTKSLDMYLEELINDRYQVIPSQARGIGVFVRGTADMLARLDTSLFDFQYKYGNAILKFEHIEESDQAKIGILLTGCADPSDRIMAIKNRYDDIMNNQTSKKSMTDELLGATANPLGNLSKRNNTGKSDMSALDL